LCELSFSFYKKSQRFAKGRLDISGEGRPYP